MLYKVKLKIF